MNSKTYLYISILIGVVCHLCALSQCQQYVIGYFNLMSDMLQLTDTLKIPRAAIQYTSQDQIRYHSAGKMIKNTTVDSLPNNDENNFETFSKDLAGNDSHEERILRHSTFSGKNLTAANLARLNKLHKNAQTKDIPPSMADREITITVDSMITTNHKPKENDSASNASSTHFTMVNGFGGSRIKQASKPVCCCNHITAVIVSMTILFMFIIFGVIIFAEYPRMMAEIE